MTTVKNHPQSIDDSPDAMTVPAHAASASQDVTPGREVDVTDVHIPDHALDAAGGGFVQEIGRVLKKAFTEPPKRYATPEEWHQAHRGEVVTSIPTIWGDRS